MADTDNEIIKRPSPTRAKAKKLRVTFAGQEPICYRKATDTFIEALKRIPEDQYPFNNLGA